MQSSPQSESSGSGGPPALHTLLAELASVLRGDSAFAREPVEVLVERIAALDGVARDRIERATYAQRSGIAQLLRADLDAAARRDLSIYVSGIESVVEAAASAPESSLSPQQIELRYSATDLAELSRVCCAPFLDLARERDLDVQLEIPDRVAAQVDTAKVQKIVLNLLFNAFKLAPRRGRVRFRLEELDRIDEADITVADSGPGVAPGNEDAIFSRDQRSERNAPSSRGKLGFDLATSRDLATLHGGSLRVVRSGRDVGAELRLRLPTRAPRQAPVVRSVAPDPELAAQVARAAMDELRTEERLGETAGLVRNDRPLVLVVEDSRVMQRILTQALSGSWAVVSALDGEEGLRQAVELRPSLIISDLRLPKVDGFELVRSIRARGDLAETPILVVSGTHDAVQTVQLLRAGVQDVMSKPFMVPELAARAHNLLQAKRARDILRDLSGMSESDLTRLAVEVTRHQRKLEAALDELRAAREIAERANQIKSNFLRMMSHELKTPVTALVLQQQILAADQHLRQAPASVVRGMASMSRSVSRLLHIVDTVLEWARVESGRCKVALRRFDLSELVGRVADECRPQADARGFPLLVRVPAGGRDVVTDSRIVRLIAINLLERAIALSDQRGAEISIAEHGAAVLVRVTDSGPPLAGEEREQLLDAFASSQDLARRGGAGSGLGLQVVSDLAGAIGGRITLADSGPAGTTIELSIPQERGRN